ncbi:MAG TPA: phosphoserine phosphatase SerB [Alphaproteobacteria bacterium]
MTFVLTLVAARDDLSAQHVATAANYIESNGIGLAGVPDWLTAHRAVDLKLATGLNHAHIAALREIFAGDGVDVFVNSTEGRRKKLLLADMDATIVTGETLDEIAALAGIGEKVAAITERAMRGELDFKAALRERVSMLAGRDTALLQQALDKMELSPGAETLVRTMAAHGAVCVLVSGGFTFFTGAAAQRAGFHYHHGNVLGVADGELTGTVADPILDKDAKLSFLRQYARDMNVAPEETMAIGDGANDLPMLEAAGLGIGYHPKPLLRERLDNCIFHGDLTAVLYAQGYRENEIRR